MREMDILKRSKSKSLLKKGFKKLKGKIQVHRRGEGGRDKLACTVFISLLLHTGPKSHV